MSRDDGLASLESRHMGLWSRGGSACEAEDCGILWRGIDSADDLARPLLIERVRVAVVRWPHRRAAHHTLRQLLRRAARLGKEQLPLSVQCKHCAALGNTGGSSRKTYGRVICMSSGISSSHVTNEDRDMNSLPVLPAIPGIQFPFSQLRFQLFRRHQPDRVVITPSLT